MKKIKCPKCLGSGVVVDQETLGLSRRWLRKRKLADVARDMGITASHLSLLERGKRSWSLELVRKHKEACR